MLINLSDVLSDQHKTVEEAIPLLEDLAKTESAVQPLVDFLKENGRGIVR